MKNEMLTSAEQNGPAWLKPLGIVVSLALFMIGIWSVPLAIFGPDRTLIPGDLGDARFNNYILEHFHRFITGQTGGYWDAPFMYPWKNVIALSDNLLGTAPFYSAFRSFGFSREGAFQLWLVTLFALNYWCCLIALRKWSGNLVLSACAAYIFAFGIYNIGQINNVQVLPKFMAPLAFLFLWNHLRTGSWKWLFLAMGATVYQFYCGVYLGFILVYALFFLFLGHLIAYRKPSFLFRFRNWRFAGIWVLALLVGLLLLTLMLAHYMAVPKEMGVRDFSDIVASIPRPSSYFLTHPAALSWRSLCGEGVAFPQWWSQCHFIGALPWLTVLATPFLLFSKQVSQMHRRVLIAIGSALVLSTVFCLNIAGFSLYKLVFMLPGFSVLRSIDRYINVQVLFFLILFVAVLRPLFRKPWAALALGLLLPVLVVQDNRWEVDRLARFDKFDSQTLVQEAERRITREYDGNGRFDAIAYEPPVPVNMDFVERHTRTINTQITAMLAAQELGIPAVNAYTGGYPGHYLSFFDNMDHRTLADWCTYNGISPERIQEVHGLAVKLGGRDTVQLIAANGRFVCAKETNEGRVLADRDKAAEWETFLQLNTTDGRVAFLCSNGNFLCAELPDRKQLLATGLDLGDFGLFTLEALDSGKVALKAFNGRYVVLDPGSLELIATSDSIVPNARFDLVHPALR